MTMSPVVESLLYIKSVLPDIAAETAVSALAMAETRYLSATGSRLTAAVYYSRPSGILVVDKLQQASATTSTQTVVLLNAGASPMALQYADIIGKTAVGAINATLDELIGSGKLILPGQQAATDSDSLRCAFIDAVKANPFFPKPEGESQVDLLALHKACIIQTNKNRPFSTPWRQPPKGVKSAGQGPLNWMEMGRLE